MPIGGKESVQKTKKNASEMELRGVLRETEHQCFRAGSERRN